MKRNKSFLLTSLFLIFLTVFISNVLAHPGRTDANGGHWNRKTGEYHYHNGEYAGRSSSGSSSKSKYEPFTPPYEPPTENPYKEDTPNTDSVVQEDSSEEEKNNYTKSAYKNDYLQNNVKSGTSEKKSFKERCFDFLIIALSFLPLMPFLIIIVIYIVKDCIYYGLLEKHLPRYKINAFDCSLVSLKCFQKDLIVLFNETDNLRQNIKIPKSYKIGKDGLPRDKNSHLDWGKTFTLYRSYKGGKLHSLYNCCYAKYPLHIYNCKPQVKSSSDFCKLCSNTYTIPDMSWYNNYLKYKQSKYRYEKMKQSCDNMQKEVNILHKKCNSIIVKFLVFFCPQNKKELKKANIKYYKLKNKHLLWQRRKNHET